MEEFMSSLTTLYYLWYKTNFTIIIGAWKRSLYTVSITVLIASLFYVPAGAQENNEWPCFHGSHRTNKSAETRLLKNWPETGPKPLWTVSGLGEGYSSISLAGGYLYTAGKIEKQTFVFAFDHNGRQIWKKPNGRSWETTMSHARAYTGSRSTPTYDDGLVYHLGETGRLTALDYKTGKEIWYRDLREQFNASIPEYGYAESVLIDGNRLYCNPAGKKGFMVCLNKKDGSLQWTNNEITGVAGYCSPILVEYGGYLQIISMSSNCVYGLDRTTGKLLWLVECVNKQELNNTDPIFHNGYVLISSGYGKGSMLIKLNVSGNKIIPKTVWQTSLMDNHHGGVILHEGYLYGSGSESRGWFCLDFMTGEQKWIARGKGSLTYADSKLYCLEENGTMKLINARHEQYDEISSFEVPEGGKGMHWAHPVVFGGTLYIRHADKLFAYDIRDK